MLGIDPHSLRDIRRLRVGDFCQQRIISDLVNSRAGRKSPRQILSREIKHAAAQRENSMSRLRDRQARQLFSIMYHVDPPLDARSETLFLLFSSLFFFSSRNEENRIPLHVQQERFAFA